MPEGITLSTFLTWLIAGGGTVVARLIIARLPSLDELDESERGLITSAIAAVLVAIAFVGAAYAGYVEMPETTLAWVEALFLHVGTAIGIPILMTAIMRSRYAAALRVSGDLAASAARPPNRLFGVRW